MTKTAITDGIVLPQDEGTGLSSAEKVDRVSAAHSALLAQHVQGSYIGDGCEFANIDTNGASAEVTAGHAFVELENAAVQAGGGEAYDTALPDPVVLCVVLPTAVSIDLAADVANEIWVALDKTANDTAYLWRSSAGEAPPDPHVKLGTVDTSDGSTTRASDEIPVSNDVDMQGRDVSGIGSADLDAIVDGADVEHTDELADVADLHERYSDEEVQDVVGTLIAGGTNVSVSYDDSGDSLTIDTSALDAEEVRDEVGALLDVGSDLTISVDDAGDTVTIGLGAHATNHESGGSDELSADGLSGDLADPQDPKTHGSGDHDNTVPELADGVVLSSQIPDLAITETHSVADETERLALDAEEGDVAIQSNESRTYIFTGGDPSLSENWSNVLFPEPPIDTVFGRTGDVTAQSGDYTYSDIEGTHGNADHDPDFLPSSDYQPEADTHDRYTNEEVQDVIGALLSGGTNITASYDDANDVLTIDTSALSQEEVEDAVASLLTSDDNLTLNYDDGNDVLTVGLSSDVSVDNLTVSNQIQTGALEADSAVIAQELGLPEYDDVSNGPQTRNRLIYATGAGASAEGIYKHDGNSYSQVGGGGTSEWTEDGSGNIIPTDGEVVGDGTTSANHQSIEMDDAAIKNSLTVSGSESDFYTAERRSGETNPYSEIGSLEASHQITGTREKVCLQRIVSATATTTNTSSNKDGLGSIQTGDIYVPPNKKPILTVIADLENDTADEITTLDVTTNAREGAGDGPILALTTDGTTSTNTIKKEVNLTNEPNSLSDQGGILKYTFKLHTSSSGSTGTIYKSSTFALDYEAI